MKIVTTKTPDQVFYGTFPDAPWIKRRCPIAPLENVLDCMKDKDYVIASAGRRYYNMYYNKKTNGG